MWWNTCVLAWSLLWSMSPRNTKSANCQASTNLSPTLCGVHAGATPGTGNSSSATYSTVKYVVPDTLASDRLLQMERLLGYSGGPAVLLYEGICGLYPVPG
jgi:hypothetical protein